MMTTLFENAPNGYFAFDEQGIVIVANNTFAEIISTTKEEIIGRSVESFFSLSTRIFFQTHFYPTIILKEFAEEIFVTLINAQGNHLPVLLNAKKTDWNNKKITACSCFHVPNRKRFEDELIAARQTAEDALRENTELIKAKSELQFQARQLDQQLQMVQMQNNELQQFNHAITHNLKEPLRKILLYSEKLTTEAPSNALSKLFRASEQMKAVVMALQQYVWLNEKVSAHKPVDLNSMAHEVLERFKFDYRLLQFSVQIDHLPTIQGDFEQLKLLFNQVISNAVKFRKGDEVRISIEATKVRRNNFRAMVGKYLYQDFVRLEFIDEGVGFDDLYSTDIFNLFRKVHQIEGLGIGLALCKKVVENHAGAIEAESKLNNFTKIRVLLPYLQNDF